MAPIQKVAIFGAAGTIGTHITSALIASNLFTLTIITRTTSTSTFPLGIPVIKTEYTVAALTAALKGQDAVVSAVGVAGILGQKDMMDAAEAAGVRRFVLSDFGYQPGHRHLPEFGAVGKPREEVRAHARCKAQGNDGWTWTGIAIGNPIDWALKKFPTMGFDLANRKAIIYDSGTERFTGTTMFGIGNAVVGVLKHADETANKQLRVKSVETCQNELLEAFEKTSGEKWEVTRSTTKELIARGREKHAAGTGGWILDLIVGQLLEEGEGRSIVANDENGHNALLGMPEENVQDMVDGVWASV